MDLEDPEDRVDIAEVTEEDIEGITCRCPRPGTMDITDIPGITAQDVWDAACM